MQGWFSILNQGNSPYEQAEEEKSQDTEKKSDKIQHPFMIKTQQSRDRGRLYQHNTGHV